MDDNQTGQPSSHLLPIVQALHMAKDRWWLPFAEGGDLDQEAYSEMTRLRNALYRTVPKTDFDALLVLGAARAVTSFAYMMLPIDKRPTKADVTVIRSALTEVLTAIDALRLKLETDAGHSLEELGFFIDDTTRQ